MSRYPSLGIGGLAAVVGALLTSPVLAITPVTAKLQPIVRSVAEESVTDATLQADETELTSKSSRLPALELKVLLPPGEGEIPATIREFVELPEGFTRPEKRSLELTLGIGGRDAVNAITQNGNDFRAVEIARPNEIPVISTPAPFNQDAARSHRVPQFIASFPPGDGNALVAAVFDGGAVRKSHQEFKTSGGSRVTLKTSKPTHFHATHVAGTMAATGVPPQQEARGMAVKLKLLSYHWDDDIQNLASLDPEVCVTNHSYGPLSGWHQDPNTGVWFWWGDRSASTSEDSKFGKYDSDCTRLDEALALNPELLTVVAAGNERGDGPTAQPIQHYVIAVNPATGQLVWKNSTELHQKDGFDQGGLDTIAGLGLAKNALCVGAINDVVSPGPGIQITSFSSWGPADDGRIKPDVVANGFQLLSTDDSDDQAYLTISGTSMASPTASGIACLLRQHFEAKHNRKPTSAELKAVIIHTARDAGVSGPDPVYGWGSVDALAAGRVIASQNGHVISGKKVVEGATETINLDATTGDPIRVTVVWIDPAGSPNTGSLDDATATLQNDLDCLLVAPDGTKHHPYSLVRTNPKSPATATGPNQVDNVEVIDAPFLAGQWQLQVKAPAQLKGGDSQAFALVVSGVEP